MYCDWWDILVNGQLLVTINGKETADFFFKSLSENSTYNYKVCYSDKNKKSAEVEPLSPWDVIKDK